MTYPRKHSTRYLQTGRRIGVWRDSIQVPGGTLTYAAAAHRLLAWLSQLRRASLGRRLIQAAQECMETSCMPPAPRRRGPSGASRTWSARTRMATRPEDAVVDRDHRVFGITILFINDGSTLPTQGRPTRTHDHGTRRTCGGSDQRAAGTALLCRVRRQSWASSSSVWSRIDASCGTLRS